MPASSAPSCAERPADAVPLAIRDEGVRPLWLE